MKDLYSKIKAIRLEKNLTQEEVAEGLGMTQGNYTRLERGQTQLTIERLQQIADFFSMSVSAIIDYNIGDKLDIKEDYQFILNQNIKLEKKIAELKKEIDDLNEESGDDFSKYRDEIDQLKAKIKSVTENNKVTIERFEKELKQKDELMKAKDDALAYRDKMVETLERTISILENKRN